MAFAKATGKRHPDLDPPNVHPSHAHLLAWFDQLSDTRGGTHNGPAPITFAEIDAWARLYGRRLACWEIDTLRRMDDACLRVYAEERAKRAAAPPKKGTT